MNRIEHEPANGRQPYVVYWVKGKTKTFRASFSTERKAPEWIDRHGDLPLQGH